MVRLMTSHQLVLITMLSSAQSDFDGSWTTFDTGILDAMSEQVYQALAHHVQHANSTRVKQVGLWSAQITAQHLLQALRNWNEREMAFA